MENFVRALALEQRQHQWPFLAVNIDPGVIDTDMQAYTSVDTPKPATDRHFKTGHHGRGDRDT
jgi:NAD(P)-dependent dehydrogenase (short-subunit alcohol dehydrogenase family)